MATGTTSYKKPRITFDRIIASTLITVSSGMVIDLGMDNTHETAVKAPETTLAEKLRLEQKAKELVEQEKQIRFAEETLNLARKNVGIQSGSNISEQFKGIHDEYERLQQQKTILTGNLADLRREYVFNPALSEKDSYKLYDNFFDSAERDGIIQKFYYPMGMALTYRDECLLKQETTAPQTSAQDQGAKVIQCGRDTHRENEFKQTGYSILSGGALGVLNLLSPFALAALRRSKKEKQDKQKEIKLIISNKR